MSEIMLASVDPNHNIRRSVTAPEDAPEDVPRMTLKYVAGLRQLWDLVENGRSRLPRH